MHDVPVPEGHTGIGERLEQVEALADRYASGRIVSLLEGGYALSALGRSVVQHLRVLAGLNG